MEKEGIREKCQALLHVSLCFRHLLQGPLSSNGAIVGHSLLETKQNKTNQADTMISFLATLPELWSALDYGYDANVGIR